MPAYLYLMGPDSRGVIERVMALEPTKVRGARLALFDVAREARLRRELLTRDQLLFTADRRNLAVLLRGGNPATLHASLTASLNSNVACNFNTSSRTFGK